MITPADMFVYLAVPYVRGGRDLRGWDCYGLYYHLMRMHHGTDVGSYSDDYPHTEGKASDEAVSGVLGRYAHRWQRVELGSEQAGDGIVFVIGGQPLHCGYVLTPGTMLHAMKGKGTTVERYDSPAWVKRIEGIYKWN